VTVFISYAHDGEGKKIAQALVEALRRRRFEVIWDRELAAANPSSLLEWVVNCIAENPVICVLSPDYIRRFGRTDGPPDRQHTLFESRQVLRKLVDHTSLLGCPVIPVALPELPFDQVPFALKNLAVARFDPETGAGADAIAERVRNLFGPDSTAGPEGSTPGT
jgi:hypothetical protein